MSELEDIHGLIAAEAEQGASAGCAAMPCSPLGQALALVDFGPCRAHPRPSQWFMVSSPMCAHCMGIENVDQAAGRILAEAYRETLAILASAEPHMRHGLNCLARADECFACTCGMQAALDRARKILSEND